MNLCRCSECEAKETPEVENYYVRLGDLDIGGYFKDYSAARLKAVFVARIYDGNTVRLIAEFEDGKQQCVAELSSDGDEVIFEFEDKPEYEAASDV